nr:putative reverse transcriptase domain-containing protein [Tanacetum cinerariifolium]
MIQETTEKIISIKQRIQAAQDREKNYDDRKRKPMEFKVGDRVMLKVLAKVGDVAYRLELPRELSRVHHTFHVSNLKKCYADKPLAMPLEGVHIDDTLQFVEEPVEIMEREIKRLKRSRIPLVKVNKARGAMIHWTQPNVNACIKENLDEGKVGKETVSAQQYVLLPLWSTGSQDPQNTDDDVADAAFDVKENENDVHVSTNGSDKTANQKHDEKAKRDDKGKRLMFPSINAISPNFGIAKKSSFMDPSKYPDDPDMPELEDIVYSDNEEDVGAEADLSNLETNIPVSPISNTDFYKDHPVNQITGFEDPDYPDKVYKVVKALYGLHQGPRA